MLEYLKTLHPIGSVGLEEIQYDWEPESEWHAAVHYYGLCSIGRGPTPMTAIHDAIAQRDEKLAETVAPRVTV